MLSIFILVYTEKLIFSTSKVVQFFPMANLIITLIKPNDETMIHMRVCPPDMAPPIPVRKLGMLLRKDVFVSSTFFENTILMPFSYSSQLISYINCESKTYLVQGCLQAME